MKRIYVTDNFVQLLKEYTRRAKLKESKKNGVRKNIVTKEMVCQDIIKDMQNARLI